LTTHENSGQIADRGSGKKYSWSYPAQLATMELREAELRTTELVKYMSLPMRAHRCLRQQKPDDQFMEFLIRDAQIEKEIPLQRSIFVAPSLDDGADACRSHFFRIP
jgi:hypothetical protein